MHSHWSIVHLCGIFWLAFGLASGRDYISENMEGRITKLKGYFNISDDLSLFGNSTFLKHLVTGQDKMEDSEQRLLMLEVLDMYVSILSSMKNHTEGDVRKTISEVLSSIESLIATCGHQKDRLPKKLLQDLWAIKVNDITVQRKALRELEVVYQKASELVYRTHMRRGSRRRSDK